MTENPYATLSSSSEIPSAPPDYGWKIHEDALLVESEARLPMIDLNSGESEDSMTLVPQRLRLKNRKGRWFLLGIGVWFGLYIAGSAYFTIPFTIVILPAVIAAVVILIGEGRAPVANIQVFLSKRINSRVQTIQYLGTAITVLFIGGLIYSIFTDQPEGLYWTIYPILFVLLLIRVILARIIKPLRNEARNPDGTFRIKGAHPKAISELTRLQDSRRKSA